MSRIPVPQGGFHHTVPHSPQPTHIDNMSTSSPASDTRRKQSKRDEVSLVCINLRGCVRGWSGQSMSMDVDMSEHGCGHERAWHGVICCLRECGCTLVHYTWCMGGNSAGCADECVFFARWKRRKTANNPCFSSHSSFLLLFLLSFFFPHLFLSTYTIHHTYTVSP